MAFCSKQPLQLPSFFRKITPLLFWTCLWLLLQLAGPKRPKLHFLQLKARGKSTSHPLSQREMNPPNVADPEGTQVENHRPRASARPPPQATQCGAPAHPRRPCPHPSHLRPTHPPAVRAARGPYFTFVPTPRAEVCGGAASWAGGARPGADSLVSLTAAWCTRARSPLTFPMSQVENHSGPEAAGCTRWSLLEADPALSQLGGNGSPDSRVPISSRQRLCSRSGGAWPCIRPRPRNAPPPRQSRSNCWNPSSLLAIWV